MLPSSPIVSAVIPSWNRRDELIACIDSLLKQESVSLEIIVVDDGSTDDSLATVREMFPDVRIITGTFQCGHPYRRNQGIRAAKGEFILHLDSDIEFPDTLTISRMLKEFEKNPKLGAIGGEIPINTGRLDRAWGLMRGRMDYPERVFVSKSDPPMHCDFLASLNYLTRRSAMLEIQGYDPYYEFGAPDMDMCFKLKEAGYDIVLQFDCAAIHKAASAGRRKDASFKYCLNGVRFCLRHHGLAVFFLRLAWYTLRIGPRIVLGRPDPREGGARLLLKAYYWSLLHLPWVLGTIRLPFLSDEEEVRFESWKKGKQNKTA